MADKTKMYSSCTPYRIAVDYYDDLPSMTRQEFADEADINKIMKQYEQHGVLPSLSGDPVYFDTTAIPDNLQDAMNGMIMAEEAFMRLGANVRREFDNDPVQFVDFAVNPENLAKLREWGLAAPEKPAEVPMRVEVVNPPTNPPPPSVEPSKG